jgi:cysteine desulfurase
MIYLDYAGTTPPHEKVIHAITETLMLVPGNPSSIHPQGFAARKVLSELKEKIGTLIGAAKSSLVFTSSGTEANNMIIQGAYFNQPHLRFITTKTEHHSVLKTFEHIESLGADVVYLDVDAEGLVDLNAYQEALKTQTALVSVLYANNETGVIQPIETMITMAHQAGAKFHSDMVQMWMHQPVHIESLNLDYATMSAHKFSGPKGIGLAYIQDATSLKPHTYGGRQENNLRAGTENIPYVAGFLMALEISQQNRAAHKANINACAAHLLRRLDEEEIAYTLNGPNLGHHRLNAILNLSIFGTDAQDLRFYLNQNEVYLSLGSACDAQSVLPSHVLTAMMSDPARLESAIRISLGTSSTPQKMDRLVELIKAYINQ